MSDTMTVRGLVATEVRLNTSDNSGLQIASFRLCSTDRRYDKDKGVWIDGNTNWYTVSMFRYLASNAAFSLSKGDRVVVTGRLKVRAWTDDSGRSGTSVDIDADAVGHDINWGTSKFTRHTADRQEQGQAGAENTAEECQEDVFGQVDTSTGEITGGEEDNEDDDAAAKGAGSRESTLAGAGAGAKAPF